MADLNFPQAPELGDLPTELTNGVTYVWDGVKWSQAGGGAGGGSSNINSGEYPPSGPRDGDLWFNSTNGILYVYYVDPDGTEQWVDSRPGGNGGGFAGGDAPTDGNQYGRQNGGWTLTDVDIDRFDNLPSS